MIGYCILNIKYCSAQCVVFLLWFFFGEARTKDKIKSWTTKCSLSLQNGSQLQAICRLNHLLCTEQHNASFHKMHVAPCGSIRNPVTDHFCLYTVGNKLNVTSELFIYLFIALKICQYISVSTSVGDQVDSLVLIPGCLIKKMICNHYLLAYFFLFADGVA